MLLKLIVQDLITTLHLLMELIKEVMSIWTIIWLQEEKIFQLEKGGSRQEQIILQI